MSETALDIRRVGRCDSCQALRWEHYDDCALLSGEVALAEKPEPCGNCGKEKGDKPGSCRCGRRTVMTPRVVELLCEAFSYGASDAEACLHAGIARGTLSKYESEHPEFLERKEELLEAPSMIARISVVDGMKTDHALALKYLERKKPDEFAPTNKFQGKIEMDLAKIHGEIVQTSRSVVEEHVIEGEIVPPDLPASV